jgi:hypothetical protein
MAQRAVGSRDMRIFYALGLLRMRVPGKPRLAPARYLRELM